MPVESTFEFQGSYQCMLYTRNFLRSHYCKQHQENTAEKTDQEIQITKNYLFKGM